MPKINDTSYQNAYDILYGEWISLHPCDFQEEGQNHEPLQSTKPQPEQMIIKQESFTLLSKEAKEIVKAILFSPDEILNAISTPKTKRITLKKIKKYFIRTWQSRFITEMALKEIEAWVKKLDDTL